MGENCLEYIFFDCNNYIIINNFLLKLKCYDLKYLFFLTVKNKHFLSSLNAIIRFVDNILVEYGIGENTTNKLGINKTTKYPPEPSF